MFPLNGTYNSIPFGMAFNKPYYCSKCGTKLEKEKTHRVVTKDDKDYYQYHKQGTFPLRDYDVYDYRFKCPSCEARIAFDEQCVIERIQKQYGRSVLSSSEIKENYEEGRKANSNRILLRNILIPTVFITLFFALYFLTIYDKVLDNIIGLSIIYLAGVLTSVVVAIIKFKGIGKMKINRSYSHEKESQLNRLHTYASHNRDLVEKSDKCYCFYCKSVFDSSEVDRYLNDEKTALCPKCNVDSVIPDSINEPLDEEIIAEMQEYWF